MFNLEPGILYSGIALIVFYLYLAWLRGRKRRLAREAAIAMRRASGAKKREMAAKLPPENAPTYEVRSWIVVGIALIIMLAAFPLYEGLIFPEYRDYYWVLVAVGVVGLAAGLK